MELDLIDEEAGGATRAQRDALKLLAVLIEHTDSKPEQQGLVCAGEDDGSASASCEHPFMMIFLQGTLPEHLECFSAGILSNNSRTGDHSEVLSAAATRALAH